MLKIIVRLGMAAGAALLALAFALPASPAMATGYACDYNTPVDTCDEVNGSGLLIEYMLGSFGNGAQPTVTGIHIELSGPQGLIKNCPQTNVLGFTTIYCRWDAAGDVPGGYYCTTAWQQYVPGKYVELGRACVDVHR